MPFQRTIRGHTGPVLGCALSADGRRALTCSSDRTARLWDLASGEELLKMEGHTSYVLGCALSADGRRALTCSDDQTARLWDLASGKELVAQRRYFSERVRSCALGAPSFAAGQLPAVLGSGFGHALAIDLSASIVSASAAWSNFDAMDLTAWIDWMAEAIISVRSARVLFQPDRTWGGETLVHRLVGLEEGINTLQCIRGKLNSHVDDKGLGCALICYLAQASAEGGPCGESPLVAALKAPGQDNAKFLLDDYRDYVEMDLLASRPDATGVQCAAWQLPERELVILFQIYPALAASFLAELPLLRTGMVTPTKRCIFPGGNTTLIEDDVSTIGSAEDDQAASLTVSPMQFWDEVAARAQPVGGDDTPVFVTAHMVPLVASSEAVSIADDAEAMPTPDARGTQATSAEQVNLSQVQKITALGHEFSRLLDDDTDDTVLTAASPRASTSPALEQTPAFSQLLQAAVKHVDQSRNPATFGDI